MGHLREHCSLSDFLVNRNLWRRVATPTESCSVVDDVRVINYSGKDVNKTYY